MAPTGQGGQWSDVLCCISCNLLFDRQRPPLNLSCGHVVCRRCACGLRDGVCPLDESCATMSIETYPPNTALLSVVDVDMTVGPPHGVDKETWRSSEMALIEMARYLKRAETERGGSVYSQKLSRTLQRKLVSLLCFQLVEEEGRSKAAKACRAIAERIMSEVLLSNQSNAQVSSQLWSAVRARGCQFLGPAMQEDVLRLILLTLEKGALIARKTLVMYVVTTLYSDYPQVSKTCVGHVVQLLYRASCFNVIKRDGESSLMQLKDEFRTYDALRREHDAQIVTMAMEAGLRISPDQWSALLYADQSHRSHMQSIIDKLQSPNSYAQSLEDLKTSGLIDRQFVSDMLPLLSKFDNIHPTHHERIDWYRMADMLRAMRQLLFLHVSFEDLRKEDRQRDRRDGVRRVQIDGKVVPNFKTKMCANMDQEGRCARGSRCTYAHSSDEVRDGLRIDGQRRRLDGVRYMPPVHLRGPPPVPLDPRLLPQSVPPPQYTPQRGPPRNGTSFIRNGRGPPRGPPINQPMLITYNVPQVPPPNVMSFPVNPTDGTIVVPPPPQTAPPPDLVSPPTNVPPPVMQMMPVLMQSPTHMPPPMIVLPPGVPPSAISNQPPMVLTNGPPPTAGGPPPPGMPTGPAIWAAPSPAASILFPTASPPHQQQHFWIQPTQGSIFPMEQFDMGMGSLVWGSGNIMRESGQDAEQLLMKRSEILNRLAPCSIDDDDGEDGGHVSYTVASSVLDDSRVDMHHPIVLLKSGQAIELPAIPVTFPAVPNEETMTMIGDLVASQRPRAPSLPHIATTTVLTTLIVDAPPTSATVQATDCSTVVMDTICQPLATPVIQKAIVTSPQGASQPQSTALIVDSTTGLLTPMMRPILVPHPQDVVSNSLDKIVDVKERLSEAQGNVSEAENEHLRMELRIAESEMAYLDPYTKNNCLLRELEQVDRELQQLQIEPARAQ